MKLFTRHTDAESLRAYAARSLDEADRLAIASHLEGCTTCRETVKLLRQVTELESQSLDASAPDDILGRVLESRAAGTRAILPIADPIPARSRRLALAAGLAVVAIFTVVFVSTRSVSAGSRTGSVRFDPAAPQPGQIVRVTYEPSAPLARYDSLVLRARFRRPGDDAYNEGPMQQRVGVLRRSGGEFTLTFRLPDSVVFAVFAVESPASDIIDDNDQQLWELVTTGEVGKPLYDALVQKQNDLMGRNWEEGLRTARALVALYPDDPDAGSSLVVYERWVLGDRIADSLLPGHRKRFAAFQAAFAEKPDLPPRIITGMVHFAMQLDDSAAKRFWNSRLQKSGQYDAEIALWEEIRLAQQYIKTEKDPRGFYQVVATDPAYFREFERVWQRVEPTHDHRLGMLAQNSLSHAIGAKDTVQLRVWAGRYHRLDPDITGGAAWLAKDMLPYATLRDTALAWLREGARVLAESPDAYRPLTATLAAQQEANRGRAQPILAELGNALIADGNPAAGLDTLRLAASYGWNPEVLRRIAQALMARGDTAAALESYARVVADPGTSTPLKDSIRALIPRSAGNWTVLVKNAANEMRQQVLERAAPRSLAGPLRLMTRSGQVQRLADVVNGKVTVVMFWSPYCGFSLQPLHNLDVLSQHLSAQGAQVVTIVDQPFSKDLDQTLHLWKAGDLSVWYDFRKDAQRAFTSFGMPNYFVLDADGRVMFAHSKLEELPRQVTALLPGDRTIP